MMYLHLLEGFFYAWDEPQSGYTVMQMADTGAGLISRWKNIPEAEDHHISGVLADWLEDNRDDLLSTATGPAPAERLDALINRLRRKFRSLTEVV